MDLMQQADLRSLNQRNYRMNLQMIAINNVALFQWVGCMFGLIGAVLLALKLPASKWGFVFFLLSNVFLLGFAIETHATGLVVMQIGFTIANVVGVFEWLVAPIIRERRLTIPMAKLQSERPFLSW
jgi:hypothetical protein